MKRLVPLTLCLCLAILIGSASVGCQKKEEGPAEKAGKKIDKALDSAKKSLKKFTE